MVLATLHPTHWSAALKNSACCDAILIATSGQPAIRPRLQSEFLFVSLAALFPRLSNPAGVFPICFGWFRPFGSAVVSALAWRHSRTARLSRWETNMSLTFFSRLASSRRFTSARWVRSTIVAGLALAVSACAYDSPHYRAHGGYSTYQHGYYGPGPAYRGYYGPGPVYRGHYSPRPDWRAQARHRQAQQRRRAEIRRHHFESRERIERQRFHEANRHRNAVPGQPRAHDHRGRTAGPRHQHQRHR